MTHFQLHGPAGGGHTLVSDLFLDEYMPSANGEYVKVYLYLLRCLKSDVQDLSISLIADKFEHTENDVRRALKYWEKLHLLKLEYNESKELTGIRLTNEDAGSRPAAQPPSDPSQLSPKPSHKPMSREDTKQLLFICEQYLGKTLSSSEVSKIMYFHDVLGFSADLIEYLVEYCVSKRHKSLRYIESVALGWHKSGYTTVSQAKEQTNLFNKTYFFVLKAFGISGRNPVEAEIAYMDKWMKEWGFSEELIGEACGRTMGAIHQPSFEYADRILERWKEKGITRFSELETLDKQHQSARRPADTAAPKKSPAPNRFHNFAKHNYDIQELEKKLINH